MPKETIQSVLAAVATGNFLEKSKALLAILGYRSERTLELSEQIDDFIAEFPALNPNTRTEQEFRRHAESVQLVFQLTTDEITDDTQQTLFEADAFNKGWATSFLFFAVTLKEKSYTRSQYAEFTREINKRLITPTVALFRAGEHLTIGFAGRRQHLFEPNRDVLEQVTLIKDIRLNDPHRAHLDILSELSLAVCIQEMRDPDKLLDLFSETPFINGGLFDCLDSFKGDFSSLQSRDARPR